jgi:TPR repeat protein
MRYDLAKFIEPENIDPQELKELEKAAKAGDPSALYLGFYLRQSGYNLRSSDPDEYPGFVNEKRALEWLEAGVKQEDRLCMTTYGFLRHRNFGKPANAIIGKRYISKTKDWLKNQVSDGHPYALAIAAVMNVNGIGTLIKRPKEAVRLCEAAIAQGEITSYSNLGGFYEDGLGVPKNTDKAKEQPSNGRPKLRGRHR